MTLLLAFFHGIVNWSYSGLGLLVAQKRHLKMWPWAFWNCKLYFSQFSDIDWQRSNTVCVLAIKSTVFGYMYCHIVPLLLQTLYWLTYISILYRYDVFTSQKRIIVFCGWNIMIYCAMICVLTKQPVILPYTVRTYMPLA